LDGLEILPTISWKFWKSFN